MPILAEVDDYKIIIYSNRGDLQGLPNIYVWKTGAEAEFLIRYEEQPRLLLRRSYGFSAKELAEVERIVVCCAWELRTTLCNGLSMADQISPVWAK